MQTPIPICFNCKHFNKETWNCEAFLKGIPPSILSGENDHPQPLPNQGNDIVYEPVTN